MQVGASRRPVESWKSETRALQRCRGSHLRLCRRSPREFTESSSAIGESTWHDVIAAVLQGPAAELHRSFSAKTSTAASEPYTLAVKALKNYLLLISNDAFVKTSRPQVEVQTTTKMTRTQIFQTSDCATPKDAAIIRVS